MGDAPPYLAFSGLLNHLRDHVPEGAFGIDPGEVGPTDDAEELVARVDHEQASYRSFPNFSRTSSSGVSGLTVTAPGVMILETG